MHSRGRLRAGRPVFRPVHLSPHICTTVVPPTPCQRLETILSYYLIFRPALIHQSRQPHHPGLSVPQCSLPFSVGAERHSSRHLNSNATPPRPGFPSPAAPPPTSFPLMPTAPSAKDHLAPPHLEPTLSSSILSCNYPPAFLRANRRSSGSWHHPKKKKIPLFLLKPVLWWLLCSHRVTHFHIVPLPGLVLP